MDPDGPHNQYVCRLRPKRYHGTKELREIALAKIHADLRSKTDFARRVAGRRWDLVLKSGATVKLPTDERLPTSLNMFATIEPQVDLTARPLSVIDLRIDGRVFLTPKPDATGGAA